MCLRCVRELFWMECVYVCLRAQQRAREHKVNLGHQFYTPAVLSFVFGCFRRVFGRVYDCVYETQSCLYTPCVYETQLCSRVCLRNTHVFTTVFTKHTSIYTQLCLQTLCLAACVCNCVRVFTTVFAKRSLCLCVRHSCSRAVFTTVFTAFFAEPAVHVLCIASSRLSCN